MRERNHHQLERGGEPRSVYTFNASLKRRLAEFSRSTAAVPVGAQYAGGQRDHVRTVRLSIRFIPPYSEERKAAASAYAKEACGFRW